MKKKRGAIQLTHGLKSSIQKHMASLLDYVLSGEECTGALSSHSPHPYPSTLRFHNRGNSGYRTIPEQGSRTLSVGQVHGTTYENMDVNH